MAKTYVRYQMVKVDIWYQISKLSDEGKLLYLYFYIAPMSNMIGAFQVRLGHPGVDLTWPMGKVEKALQELINAGFVLYDRDNELIVIIPYLSDNPINNDKQLIGAISILKRFPLSKILYRIISYIRHLTDRWGAIYPEKWNELPEQEEYPLIPIIPESQTQPQTKEESPDNINEIFEYWKRVMNMPDAVFSNDRKAKIRTRLNDGYTKDQIKEAIDNCKVSPFHQGDNDRNILHNDIELICRNVTKLDYFLKLGRKNDPIERGLREIEQSRSRKDDNPAEDS